MIHELSTPNLEAFLHDFRCKLIHAVIHGPAYNMLDSTALVVGSTMLTDVLNAPISKLTMSKHVNLRQYFFDRRSLSNVSICLTEDQLGQGGNQDSEQSK